MNKQFLSLLLLASFVTSSIQSGYPQACFAVAKSSLLTLGMRNFANLEAGRAAALRLAGASILNNAKIKILQGLKVSLAPLGALYVGNDYYSQKAAQEALNNRRFYTKALDAVKNNRYVVGSAVAAAAVGGVTYGLMNKYSEKTDKKVNAAVSTGVAATTGAVAYFGKDKIVSGLSYVGCKLSPLGSTVKDAFVKGLSRNS